MSNFRLRELRIKHGMTQLQLGMKLNIPQNTISRLERLEYQADYDELIQIADFFHVSVDYLLGHDE